MGGRLSAKVPIKTKKKFFCGGVLRKLGKKENNPWSWRGRKCPQGVKLKVVKKEGKRGGGSPSMRGGSRSRRTHQSVCKVGEKSHAKRRGGVTAENAILELT